ncbi:hypothetical protein Asp14428_20620 [Actinoplanes sp. NBRC 14428]|nr:hypothetical protein Asp14428_20620 [Actinoplanes sp. NBRC 14428]
MLAAHGDESDVPALLAGWDDLAGRCGYQDLAAGLARIGGPAAREGVDRLHAAWLGPHSAERAACLRALLVLDPAGSGELLVEGLWDCESDVRELAAAHASPGRPVRDRLAELSGDPIETPGVRAAAAARLP